MDKSPEAFRTISEVAEALDVPPHVLRFWETRFAQVKPVKRGGGRRYYRPEDVRLLRGIRGLLYDDGMTIKGVQKILRERGIRHVIGLGTVPDAEAEAEPMADAAGLAPAPGPVEAPAPNGIRRPQRDLFEPQPQAQAAGPVAQLAGRRETRSLDKEALRALIEQLKALRDVMTEEPER
jgi:DNA-binding transcriptional MerR regulator